MSCEPAGGIRRRLQQRLASPRQRSARIILPRKSLVTSHDAMPPLIEGIGFGAFEQALSELPRRLRVKRARELIGKIVIDAPPENLEISIEGESIAARFAVVEIIAIPLVGPRLPLAPEADPSDRSLDICFVGDTGAQRQGFARCLEDPNSTDAGQELTLIASAPSLSLSPVAWSTCCSRCIRGGDDED